MQKHVDALISNFAESIVAYNQYKTLNVYQL